MDNLRIAPAALMEKANLQQEIWSVTVKCEVEHSATVHVVVPADTLVSEVRKLALEKFAEMVQPHLGSIAGKPARVVMGAYTDQIKGVNP